MLKLHISSRWSVRNWMRHILSAWLIAAAIEFLLVPTSLKSPTHMHSIAQMSLLRLLCITGVIAVTFDYLTRFQQFQRIERWILPGAFALLSVLSLITRWSLLLAGLCALVLVILCVYALRGWNNAPLPTPTPKKAKKRYFWLTLGLSLCVFLFMSIWSVCKHLSYHTYSFDFGIFVQMFHNMKTTGLPTTTLERDQILSHFNVHVSPIYYLMLPFYWLFPSPLTLQVLQAAVIVSAVIPLWKLAGHHGLSGLQRFLICSALLLAPALSAGVNYDLHENCFLTVLILWLFYGIDAKKLPTLTVAAVLTLLVKEDAPVYVAVIGLWQMVSGLLHRQRWSIKTGSVLLGGAVVYFLGVTAYLANFGDGVMSTRYLNFMTSQDGSLLSVMKCILLSPMKAIYECATMDKIKYVIQTLLPLLALPLLTRRFERCLLLIPYVLVNLLSDYPHQFDILCQYNFGTLAFLIYLTVVVLSEWRLSRRRTMALLASVVASGALFYMIPLKKGVNYSLTYLYSRETYRQIDQILETIPEDSSVCSAPRFSPHIASRTTLYDLEYCSSEHLLGCEYVVVDLKHPSKRMPKLIEDLYANDYTETHRLEGQLAIYQLYG